MLAPRKKLWSTPESAINMAGEMVSLSSKDLLFDVGCGDGRVLIHLAATTECRNFVGIEINPDRVEEAKTNIEMAKSCGKIPSDTHFDIRCTNALSVQDYHKASVIFLYLVPRGLRIMKPLFREAASFLRQNEKQAKVCSDTKIESFLYVVTYMAGFEDEVPIDQRTCEVQHQKGSAWPIYLYRF